MKHVMKFMLVTSFMLLVSTFLFATDPAQEFSITRNPNGVWSYGFTQTLGGPLMLYTTGTANAPGAPGGDLWNLGGITCDNSCVSRSQRQEVISGGVDVVFPFDTLHLHPGSVGQYSIVRWTAPLSGVYQVRGSFQGSQRYGPTTDVHIQWNSVVALFQGSIDGFGDVALFDVQQQVVAGDTIDFAVGIGSDGNFYGDSTALQFRIDLLPAINIKPGDSDNKIHVGTPGTVLVAVLSDASFDAPAMVVKSSLTFGRIGDEQSLVFKPDRFDTRLQVPVCSAPDVNGDGLKDLVCQFDKQLAGFQFTDTSGVLRGKTTIGTTIKGTDAVHVVK